jgi:hypothetical protein
MRRKTSELAFSSLFYRNFKIFEPSVEPQQRARRPGLAARLARVSKWANRPYGGRFSAAYSGELQYPGSLIDSIPGVKTPEIFPEAISRFYTAKRGKIFNICMMLGGSRRDDRKRRGIVSFFPNMPARKLKSTVKSIFSCAKTIFWEH